MECNEQKIKLGHQCRQKIIKIMQECGYLGFIQNAGSEYSRVREFFELFDQELPQHSETNKLLPCPRLFPLFPGIQNELFPPKKYYSYVAKLEEHYHIIKREALNLSVNNDYFSYGIKNMQKNSWYIHLFSYMGYNLNENADLCPMTRDILSLLPNRCQIYPWGDALFSALEPGSHIPAHYSVDNLRVRCMLGLVVPDGCRMRVGDTITHWEEGKVLLFEDSFEHEVWHNGNSRRIVLIMDFWHFSLQQHEIEALEIGLSHPEIIQQIYNFLSNDSKEYSEYLKRAIKHRGIPQNFYHYWNKNKVEFS